MGNDGEVASMQIGVELEFPAKQPALTRPSTPYLQTHVWNLREPLSAIKIYVVLVPPSP